MLITRVWVGYVENTPEESCSFEKLGQSGLGLNARKLECGPKSSKVICCLNKKY